MKQRLVLLLSLLFATVLAVRVQSKDISESQDYTGTRDGLFRLTLGDKRGTACSPEHPQKFLSRKAIERRERQGLRIDSTDLPVSGRYLDAIRKAGAHVVGTSKWLNSVLVSCPGSGVERDLQSLPFVTGFEQVWHAPDTVPRPLRHRRVQEAFNPWDSIPASHYAAAASQTEQLGGHKLHAKGFTGRGMTIAVLDGGFENVDRIRAFRKTKILGTHDFVYPLSPDIYRETDHGTKVLSLMGAWAPNVFVGTAPGAGYWLLRCEDQQTEQPVEEDYWVMAAEFADSVGADIINSSLGYTEFDHHVGDHRYEEMDGHTAFISRAASMLASKGIVLVNSAGNNGMGPWKKVSFPADADNIITVGAVTPTLSNAPFCSVGPTQDGRIKPDVMAVGSPAWLISGRGSLTQDMGTSFAAPIVCGLVACLWQAFPNKTALEIIDMVRHCGSNHKNPNTIFGYGIPDFSSFVTP